MCREANTSPPPPSSVSLVPIRSRRGSSLARDGGSIPAPRPRRSPGRDGGRRGPETSAVGGSTAVGGMAAAGDTGDARGAAGAAGAKSRSKEGPRGGFCRPAVGAGLSPPRLSAAVRSAALSRERISGSPTALCGGVASEESCGALGVRLSPRAGACACGGVEVPPLASTAMALPRETRSSRTPPRPLRDASSAAWLRPVTLKDCERAPRSEPALLLDLVRPRRACSPLDCRLMPGDTTRHAAQQVLRPREGRGEEGGGGTVPASGHGGEALLGGGGTHCRHCHAPREQTRA